MNCPSCASDRQAEFTAEINIHLRGLKNLEHPGVLVFPKVLICLDCGFSRFITPQKSRLVLLAMSSGTATDSTRQKNLGDVASCSRIAP